MPKRENQKSKLLVLLQVLQEETDMAHMMTAQELLSALRVRGIEAERRTLYRDLRELQEFGIDIKGIQSGRNYYYCIDRREFELAELKLLVDSVQSSRFLTERTSQRLIRKLEHLTSRHQARQLQRQVILSGRIKSTNESDFANVDRLHTAISSNRQVRFRYFQWNLEKEKELRHNGRWYHASPWGLVVNDQNYYLLAYSQDDRQMRTYRVDKMLSLSVMKNMPREGREAYEQMNPAEFAQETFGMFTGRKAQITLRVDRALAGVVIDRFGQETMLVPDSETHFTASVSVAVSERFFGWVIGFGDKMVIQSPAWARDAMREHLRRAFSAYD